MSKLGPHVIERTPEAMAWSKVAPIVKALNNPTPLAVAHDSAIRIYRRYFEEQDLIGIAHSVDDVVNAILNGLGGYRHPRLYVEIYNEIPREMTLDHINFLKMAVPRLKSHGLKVCGPCWATGDYDEAHWAMMRLAGWCGLDAVAVHCYWASEGLTPWNALRYRTYWRRGDPPVVITECGRDRVRDGYGGVYVGNGGWRLDNITAEQYIKELVDYDVELRLDQFVLGATVFTAGPTPDWKRFDVDGLVAQLIPRFRITDSVQIPDWTGGNVTEAELLRNAEDVWRRGGGVFRPENAFCKYWLEQSKRGRYFGLPDGLEYRTENGVYMVQRFASAVLHAKIGEWVVKEGWPPLLT